MKNKTTLTGQMKRYKITLHGETPLIMHRDNLAYSEKIKQWQKAPENKALSIAGDDRSPAWTWIGYLYHNGKHVGIDSDNMMTMLREGGAKVSTGRGKETYKKATQSGVMIDQQQFALLIDGKQIEYSNIKPLIEDNDFMTHIEHAEALGFELLVKRAKINTSKHVRVRPIFRTWTAVGSITVLDDELSGLTKGVIETILRQAGALVGLCDWRPSSPKSSGTFGRFTSSVEEI